MFDSYCIYLIAWPSANTGDCRSRTLRQTGNTEKKNQQLSIVDTDWHHHIRKSPHTWINANKRTRTMIRHLWNLQSICRLNTGPLAWCPPATLWSPLSSLLCPSMKTRQPDKTQNWPAAACSSLQNRGLLLNDHYFFWAMNQDCFIRVPHTLFRTMFSWQLLSVLFIWQF